MSEDKKIRPYTLSEFAEEYERRKANGLSCRVTHFSVGLLNPINGYRTSDDGKTGHVYVDNWSYSYFAVTWEDGEPFGVEKPMEEKT